MSERRLALFAKFRAIAGDRVQRLQERLPKLCEPVVNEGVVVESLRELHTLKGESRMLSLVSLNEVAHATEELLVALKGRGAGLTAQERGRFRQGLDLCGDLLRLDDFGPGPYEDDIRRFLTRAEEAPGATAVRDKSVAAVEVAPVPPPTAQEDASPVKEPAAAAPVPEVVTGSAPVAARRLETARVSVSALEGTTEAVGTLLLRHDEMSEYAHDIGRLHRDLNELFAALRVRTLARRDDEDGGLARVVERGSALLREMNVSLTRLLDAFFDHRGRILDLQDAMRTMRLQPVQSLLDPLPSALRSLGHQQGKTIEMEVDDGAVVVDTKVLEVLDTALLHLLRNAIDHGLESPAARVAAGKPEAGRLRVAVKSLGALVEVTVYDDGGGVDRERVRRIARERQLLTEEAAAQWSDAQVDDLLFAAGFSTRSEVTDVSGRGVGLDAVRSAVEAVGGSISLHSIVGAGTEFRLLVPVTVALTRVLVVQATEGYFAFPTTYVEKVVTVDSGSSALAGALQTVTVDGRPLPAAPLSVALGFPARNAPHGSAQYVVLHNAGRSFALGVQKVVGEREVVLRSLNPLLAGLGVVNATAMLQGGRLLQVTHVPTLAQAIATVTTAPVEVTTTPRRARPRILVVDDSELTRDMLVDLAARIGTEPLEAVDGFDGLRVLEQQRVDLVLTDLDMPVLDGIGLIERIRQAPALRELPVVVLSTRGSDQDKERAMRAGANAYLVKAAFKPQDLRQALESFLLL